jgi:hypothetical protein
LVGIAPDPLTGLRRSIATPGSGDEEVPAGLVVTHRGSPSPAGGVEHRLFSHISMNWRGRPLVSHRVMVELIAATPDPLGSAGPRGAGPWPLCAGREDPQPGAGRHAVTPPRLARGVELHRAPHCCIAVRSNAIPGQDRWTFREPGRLAAPTAAATDPIRRATGSLAGHSAVRRAGSRRRQQQPAAGMPQPAGRRSPPPAPA